MPVEDNQFQSILENSRTELRTNGICGWILWSGSDSCVQSRPVQNAACSDNMLITEGDTSGIEVGVIVTSTICSLSCLNFSSFYPSYPSAILLDSGSTVSSWSYADSEHFSAPQKPQGAGRVPVLTVSQIIPFDRQSQFHTCLTISTCRRIYDMLAAIPEDRFINRSPRSTQ